MSPGIFSKKYTIPWNVKVTSFEALNTSRFLKSYHAENPQTKQDFILKVFVKLEDIDLSIFKFMLSHYREKINRCCPHVLPYMGEYESKTHGFLIRPMLYQSLPEFILQNPWLTRGHKVLYSIQMILAVKEMHEAGLVHGDIKLSNFLVTHTHSLMLTDFAPFKPYQVSMSNPVALSYYFTDTIAPERIVQADEELDTLLLPTMEADVFSLGSALLELWTSIKPFDLPTLFEYRDAKTGNIINYVLSLLDHITHEELRGLVHAMINPIPSQRIDLSTLQIRSIFTPEELFASDIILCFLKFFNPLNLDDVVHVGATLFDGICDMYLNSSSSQKAALTKCYFCDIHHRFQFEQQQQQPDDQHASKKASTMARASSTINLGAQSSANITRFDLPQDKKHQAKKPIEMPYLCTTNMEIPFKIIEQLDGTVLRSLATCDCVHRILKEGRTSEVSWNCNVFGPFRRILASDTLQAAMYHIAYSIMRLIQLDAFSISDTYKKGILTVCSYALFMDDSYVSHLIRMAYRVFRLRPTAVTLGGVAYLLNLLTTAYQDIHYIPLLVMGEVFLPKNQHDRFLEGVEIARHQLLDVESLDEKAFESLANIFLYTAGSSSTTYPYLINHSYVIQLFPLLLASVARLSGGDPSLKVIINAILLRNKTSLLYNILRSTSITPIILSSIRLLSDNIVLISSLLPGILPLYLDFLGRTDLRKITHFCLGDAIASIFGGCLDQLEPSCKHITSLKTTFQGARGAHSGKDIFFYVRIFLNNYHPLRDDKAAGTIFAAILKSISILPLDLQSTCIYLFCKSVYIPSVQLSDDLGRSLWSPNNQNIWLLLNAIKTVIEKKDSQDALLFSFFLNDNFNQYVNIRLAGALMKILTLTVRSFDLSTQDSSQYAGVLIKRHVKQSVNDRRHQVMHIILPKLSPVAPQIVENLHLFYPDLHKYSSFSDDVSTHHDPDYDIQHEVLRKIQENYALIERLTFLTIDDLTNPQRYLFMLQEVVHAASTIIENLTTFVQQIAISTSINTDNLQEKHEENLPLYLLVKDMPTAPDANPSFSGMHARTQDDILHSSKELSRANFSASQRMDFRSLASLNDASIWTDASVSRVAEELMYAGHGSSSSRHLIVSNEYQVLLKDGERARHVVELFYGPVGDAKDRMKEILFGKDQEASIEDTSVQYSTYSLIPEISTLPDESVLHSTLFSSLLSACKPFLITDASASIRNMLRPGILSGYLCKSLNMQSVVLARRWLPFLRESSLPPSALPKLLNTLLNNLLIISPGTHSLPTSNSLIQHVCKQFKVEDMLSDKPTEIGREFITIPGLQHDLKNTSVIITYQNPLAYSRHELVKYIVAETQVALDFISMRANPRGDLIMNSKTIQGMQSNNPLYTHYSNLIRAASDLIINASITHHVNKTPYRALLPANSVSLNDIQGPLERIGTIQSKLAYDFVANDHVSMTSKNMTLPGCVQTRVSYNYASLKSFTYSAIGNMFIILDTKNYIHFYLNPVDEAIKFLAQRILLLSRTVKISMESSPEAHADHYSVLAGLPQGLPQLQTEPKHQKITAPVLTSSPALESLESIMEYLSTGVLTLPLATFHIPGVSVLHIFVDPCGIPILGGGKATEKKSVRHEFLALNIVTDSCVVKLLVDPDMLIQQYTEAILVTDSNCNANRAGGVTFSMNDAVFSLSISGSGKSVELVDFGMLHKTQLNGALTENTIQYLLPYLTADQICTFLKAYHNDSVTEKSSAPKVTHLYMHSTLSASLDHANGVELLLTRLRYKNQFPLNLKSAESQVYSVMPHRILTYYNCYLLSEIVAILSTTVVTCTALYDGTSGNRMYTLPKEFGEIQYACESASGSIAVLTSMGWLILLEFRAGNLLDLWVLAEKQRYNVHSYPAILGFNGLLSPTHSFTHEAEESAEAITESITESIAKPSVRRYYAITSTLFIVAYGSHVVIYEFDSKLENPVLQFVGGLDVRMSGHTKNRTKQQEKPAFSAITSHENSCILGLSNGAVLMVNECEKEIISCKMLSSPNKYRITSNIDLASTDTVTNNHKKFGVFFSNQPSGLVAHQGPVVAIKSSGHSVFSADTSGLILFYH